VFTWEDEFGGECEDKFVRILSEWIYVFFLVDLEAKVKFGDKFCNALFTWVDEFEREGVIGF